MPTVLAIAGAVDIPVQTGGGVRSEADVVELLEGGVSRVVLGTVALDDPGLVGDAGRAGIPGRVAVGVDYRRDRAGGPRSPSGAGSRGVAGPSPTCSASWTASDWPR